MSETTTTPPVDDSWYPPHFGAGHPNTISLHFHALRRRRQVVSLLPQVCMEAKVLASPNSCAPSNHGLFVIHVIATKEPSMWTQCVGSLATQSHMLRRPAISLTNVPTNLSFTTYSILPIEPTLKINVPDRQCTQPHLLWTHKGYAITQ